MNTLDIFKEQQKLRIPLVRDVDRLIKLKQEYNLPADVKIKNLGKRNGLNIFIVDGNKIRKAIDIDFTMGGHGLRYMYIPINEIWIDSSNKEEIEEMLVHEITEFNLMKKGMSYDDAHVEASLVEMELRNSSIISIQQKSFVKVASH